MAISVIIHIANEDPILGELENMPALTDNLLVVKNPRRRDGKDLHYLLTNVTEVIWPLQRISFIEILPKVEDDDYLTPWRN